MLTIEEMRFKSRSLALPMDYSFSFPMVLVVESSSNCCSYTSQVKTSRPYYNFARGLCHFGNTCKFGHNESMNSMSINSSLWSSSSNSGVSIPNGNTTSELLATLLSQLGITNNNILVHNAFNASTGTGITLASDPATGAWNIDTGASSHLNDSVTSLSEFFNACIYPSAFIDDGHTIPITNTTDSILPTPPKSLYLNNVFITPNIVKKLIFIRQFVRDKDFMTRETLRASNMDQSSKRLAFVILIDLEHFGLCYLETSFTPMRRNLMMPPRMTTRSACRSTAAPRGGGMGGRVGRGSRRNREPVRKNNKTIGELDGQGNNRGVEANGGVGGVPDFSTIIAQ
nr:ribonuclease H-like domain-containing protein [Tanacetum cinerariifolium]